MSQISPPIRIVLDLRRRLHGRVDDRPEAEARHGGARRQPATTATQAPTAQSAAGQFAQRAEAARRPPSPRPRRRPARTRPPPQPTRARRRQAGTTRDGRRHRRRPRRRKPVGLPTRVRTALADDKVVVLLFWTPRAADDRAVHAELAKARPPRRQGRRPGGARGPHRALPAHHPRRRRRASPLTVVVVGRDRKAETLVGYVDHVSVDQLVTDALRNS